MVKGVTDSVPRPLHSHDGLVFAACHVVAVVHGRVWGTVAWTCSTVSGARDVRGRGVWSEVQVSGAILVGGWGVWSCTTSLGCACG